MIDWLKNINKPYPEFWKKYLAKFDSKTTRYVVLSLETSGLNPEKDVIMSFGALGVTGENIFIGDHFEAIIPQYKYLHDNGISNDFLLETTQEKMAEPVAVEGFINYIENAILVGHRIHFDVDMINKALEKLDCGRLKNEAIDIEIMYKKLHDINDRNFSLDELASLHKLPKYDRLSTSDDAYNIALLFLKLKAKLGLK